MARARPPSLDEDSDDIAPDALSLLRRDHRLAEELFDEIVPELVLFGLKRAAEMNRDVAS